MTRPLIPTTVDPATPMPPMSGQQLALGLALFGVRVGGSIYGVTTGNPLVTAVFSIGEPLVSGLVLAEQPKVPWISLAIGAGLTFWAWKRGQRRSRLAALPPRTYRGRTRRQWGDPRGDDYRGPEFDPEEVYYVKDVWADEAGDTVEGERVDEGPMSADEAADRAKQLDAKNRDPATAYRVVKDARRADKDQGEFWE